MPYPGDPYSYPGHPYAYPGFTAAWFLAKAGTAAGRGAAAGTKTITPRTVYTKSGLAAVRGAPGGPKAIAVTRFKAGTGAVRGAPGGPKVRAFTRFKGGTGAVRGVSQSGAKAYAKGHFRTGTPALRGRPAGTRNLIHFTEYFGTAADPGQEALAAPYLTPPGGLRFIAQNIMDGRFVDWDLPLIKPQITYRLSGPTLIKASIEPENLAIVEEQIDAWATWIHVESAGQIRASGICQPVEIDGERMSVEAIGVSGYPAGMPFLSELSQIEYDVLDAVRAIWRHLLSYPDAEVLGVDLSQNTSGVFLGTPALPEYNEDGSPKLVAAGAEDAAVTAAKAILARVQSGQTVDEDLTWPGAPQVVNDHNDDIADDYYGSAQPNLAVFLQTYITQHSPGVQSYSDPKPYMLNWWSDVDCGREIDSLAKAAPFDYVESWAWSLGWLGVEQRIELGYPRAGRLRDDLRFVLDENVIEALVVREDPDVYASQVVVRGRGEGRDGIRGSAGTRAERRVRRAVVVVDQNIPWPERAASVAADELRRRQSTLTVGEITVYDWHPNAPIGSYQVGDDIVVQTPISYLGEVRLTHRILSYTWAPDDGSVNIELARSDSFAYGRWPGPQEYEGEIERMVPIDLKLSGSAFATTVMVECGVSSQVIKQAWITFGVNGGGATFTVQAYNKSGATIGGPYGGDSGIPHGYRSVIFTDHQSDFITLPSGCYMVTIVGSVTGGGLPAASIVVAPKV